MLPPSTQTAMRLPAASAASLGSLATSAGSESSCGAPNVPLGGRTATATWVAPAQAPSPWVHAAIVVPSGVDAIVEDWRRNAQAVSAVAGTAGSQPTAPAPSAPMASRTHEMV